MQRNDRRTLYSVLASSDPEMTNGHTLVIPTYNRPALLKRLVQYYHKRAWPMKLLVLDSSKAKVTEENAKALSLFGESVRHIVFPGTTPVAAKFSQGLDLVQTPYASFCGDDDLVFQQGLQTAIAFLQDHTDYVCAHGLYLNFRQEGHVVHLMREYAGPGNEATHPGARIFRLLQKYESLFYGVFRTTDLRDIFSAVASVPTLHYQELFQSVAALIKGKVKRFPRLYAARQSCPPAEPKREKWQTYHWFADNPAEVLDEYRAYCGELWKFYEAHGTAPRLDKKAFFKTLDLAHAVYFSAGCPPEYFHSVLQQHWPEDPYHKIANMDLFDQLRSPVSRDGPDIVRMLAVMRHVLWAIWSAPSLARLNHNVKKTCRTPWKCRLHLPLWWLATVPEFRSSFLELCHYLDQS
jgi:glycosyltransferase domain-containing protein